MRKGMWLLLAATASPLTAQTPAPSSADTIWYAIAADTGAQLGYASRQIVDTPEGRQVIDYSLVRVQEVGDPPNSITERSVVRLDPQGRVVSISDRSQMGTIESSIDLRVSGDVAEVVRVSGGERRTQRVPLPPGTRFD